MEVCWFGASQYGDMPVSESAPCSTKAEKFEHGNDQGPAEESVIKASGFFLGGRNHFASYSQRSQRDPKDSKGLLWISTSHPNCLSVVFLFGSNTQSCVTKNVAVLDANCKVSTRSTCHRCRCSQFAGTPRSLNHCLSEIAEKTILWHFLPWLLNSSVTELDRTRQLRPT